jgi:hypothetical protein
MRKLLLSIWIAAGLIAVVFLIRTAGELTAPLDDDGSAAPATVAIASPAPAYDVLARSRLRDLTARVDDLADRAAGEPTTIATSAATAAPELDDEEIAAELAGREDAMEEAIRTGSRDAWATESESSLSAAYRAVQGAHGDLQITLSQVACTAELCRVVLAVAGGGGPADALGLVTRSVPWPGERLLKAVPGDRPEVIIYAARDGIPLPR